MSRGYDYRRSKSETKWHKPTHYYSSEVEKPWSFRNWIFRDNLLGERAKSMALKQSRDQRLYVAKHIYPKMPKFKFGDVERAGFHRRAYIPKYGNSDLGWQDLNKRQYEEFRDNRREMKSKMLDQLKDIVSTPGLLEGITKHQENLNAKRRVARRDKKEGKQRVRALNKYYNKFPNTKAQYSSARGRRWTDQARNIKNNARWAYTYQMIKNQNTNTGASSKKC